MGFTHSLFSDNLLTLGAVLRSVKQRRFGKHSLFGFRGEPLQGFLGKNALRFRKAGVFERCFEYFFRHRAVARGGIRLAQVDLPRADRLRDSLHPADHFLKDVDLFRIGVG